VPRKIAGRNEEDFIVINLNVWNGVSGALSGGEDKGEKINIPFILLDKSGRRFIYVWQHFKKNRKCCIISGFCICVSEIKH
jgi:hypothetical protein